jgi:hypothetical protein
MKFASADTQRCRLHIEEYRERSAVIEGMPSMVTDQQVQIQAERAAGLIKLLARPGAAILGDPVGTGKTPVALAAAAVLLEKELHHVLVVAPNAHVAEEWLKRAQRMSLLKSRAKLLRKTKSRAKGGLYVTTHGELKKFHKRPVEPADTLFIVDEAHRGLQSAGTQASETMYKQAEGCRMLLVTATPFQLSTVGLLSMLSIPGPPKKDDAHALRSYGEAVRRLLARWERTENLKDERVVEAIRVANEARPRAMEALRSHMLPPFDPDAFGITPPPKPKLSRFIPVSREWAIAYQVARIVPELLSPLDAEDSSANAGKGDMFQRELVSSSEAFWASMGGRCFRENCVIGKRRELLEQLESRLGSGADHPKIRKTVEWVAQRARKRHVLIYCVFRETQAALAASLRAVIPANRVRAPESVKALSDETLKVFRREDAKTKLVLVVRDNLSESIDLDGGRPCLVHHDLAWNPVRLAQRMGRIRRIGSGFQDIAAEDIFIPCLDVPVDIRMKRTVLGRADMANLVLFDAAAESPKDGGWLLSPEVMERIASAL